MEAKYVIIIMAVTVFFLAVLNLGILLPLMLKNNTHLTGIKIGSSLRIRAKLFVKENKTAVKGQTVFVGDSITDGYDLNKYFGDITEKTGERFYNRGIGGDFTAYLLSRMESTVFPLEPRCMVLLIGTNDLSRRDLDITNDGIAENIKTILLSTREACPYCRLILEGIYPVNPYIKDVNKRRNDDILYINAILKSFCEEEAITYIDLKDTLSDQNGNLNRHYSDDGLHLNAAGYEVVTEVLKGILA